MSNDSGKNDMAEADFQALLRVAGITIPPDRYAIMLDAYRNWLELVKVLDEPLPMPVEPMAAPRFGGAA